MNNISYIALGFSIIFIATTLGSAMVYFFKKQFSTKAKQIVYGFSSGIMIAAAIFSLLIPAIDDKSNTYMPEKAMWIIPVIGFLLGCLFLFGIDKIVPHLHFEKNEEEGVKTKSLSKGAKMFLAVTIHNVPEGLSVGVAFGSALAAAAASGGTLFGSNSELMLPALMLSLGIAIQNFPEGAGVAIPLLDEKYSRTKAFVFGTLSGIVEPIAAFLGFFLALKIQVLMPWALSFAAGCMIYVVIEELLPETHLSSTTHYGTWSFIIGFIVMMILDIALVF